MVPANRRNKSLRKTPSVSFRHGSPPSQNDGQTYLVCASIYCKGAHSRTSRHWRWATTPTYALRLMRLQYGIPTRSSKFQLSGQIVHTCTYSTLRDHHMVCTAHYVGTITLKENIGVIILPLYQHASKKCSDLHPWFVFWILPTHSYVVLVRFSSCAAQPCTAQKCYSECGAQLTQSLHANFPQHSLVPNTL